VLLAPSEPDSTLLLVGGSVAAPVVATGATVGAGVAVGVGAADNVGVGAADDVGVGAADNVGVGAADDVGVGAAGANVFVIEHFAVAPAARTRLLPVSVPPVHDQAPGV